MTNYGAAYLFTMWLNVTLGITDHEPTYIELTIMLCRTILAACLDATLFNLIREYWEHG